MSVMRQAAYAATLFVTSAAALVVEILAGRMLAPYVGMSLYTWTAVIAVVLAGLSCGHWIGGVLAAPAAGATRARRSIAFSLCAASASAALTVPLLRLLAHLLDSSPTPPLLLILLLAGGVFFAPSLFVGIVSPILTKLALDDAPDAQGRILGRMFALGAAGSIFGTLAAGYVFISWIGSAATMLMVAGVYASLGLAFLWRNGNGKILAILSPVALLSGWAITTSPGFAAPCDVESDYYCIRVVDFTPRAGRPSAAMILDHLAHSINDRDDPTLLISPYLHFIAERTERRTAPNGPRAFFIGGGAFTLPRAWAAKFPDAELTVAEIDPLVTETAAQRMWLDPVAPSLRIVHADARRALAELPNGKQFDLILGDAFHDYAIPAHLVTREFHQMILRRLAPGGTYGINVIDQSENPRFAFALAHTMRQDFPVVEIWLDDDSRRQGGRVTFVVLGLLQASPTAALSVQTPMPRRWLRWPETDLAARIAASDPPLLTDDFAPVDRLMAGFVMRPDEKLH